MEKGFWPLLLCVFILPLEVEAWRIDFSRREEHFPQNRQHRQPASVRSQEESVFNLQDAAQRMLRSFQTAQPIAIILTKNGFIPDEVKLLRGQRYDFHFVNINPEKRNVSISASDFSLRRGLYYGDVVKVTLDATESGIFRFFSPEVQHRGHFVVIQPEI